MNLGLGDVEPEEFTLNCEHSAFETAMGVLREAMEIDVKDLL